MIEYGTSKNSLTRKPFVIPPKKKSKERIKARHGTILAKYFIWTDEMVVWNEKESKTERVEKRM